MDINLIKDMADAVKATTQQQARTSPYDTQATVKRIEDGTAWVHIDGGVDETPVKLTIACKPGDKVQVRVGGGSAWLVGNASAPPTDDTRANAAYDLAMRMRKTLSQTIREEADKLVEEGVLSDKTVMRIVIEHCLASARVIPLGGKFEDIQFSPWSEVMPQYIEGKFYWSRIVTYYTDGTVEYGAPYFDMQAQVTAEVNVAVQEAQDTADEAERIAREAAATAGDGHRIFNSTPVPPYNINDMWFDGAHSTVYLCSTAKEEGQYFAQSDWTVYSTDVSNHFWYDASGAHVAENQGDVTTGASQTISSSGTVMMRNGKVISSWTGTGPSSAAINFYDCSNAGEQASDLIASYGRAGITHYINNVVCQALTASGLSFFNPDSAHHWTEAIFGPSGVQLYALGVLALAITSGSLKFYDDDGLTELAEFSATEAQIGKDAGPHTHIGTSGMQIFGGDGTLLLANIGYGEGNAEVGTEVEPYYSFGDRVGIPGNYSMAEGSGPEASGVASHAEGDKCAATAQGAHSEGVQTEASAVAAHSEGETCTASGRASHAEGSGTSAARMGDHSEGVSTTASGGYGAHAEGYNNTASGAYSHAGGVGNTAAQEAQTVIGKYAPAATSLTDDLFVVGNGTSASARSYAMRLKKNGRAEFAGAVGSGLSWDTRSEMVTAMADLLLYRPYQFYAGATWANTAGAGSHTAFGTICKMTTTSWHLMFMCGGSVYKSVFDNSQNPPTFSTTLIG